MVSLQGFDCKIKELENKKERMKTLALCMKDDDEKLNALTIINSLQSKSEQNGEKETNRISMNSKTGKRGLKGRSMSLNLDTSRYILCKKLSKLNKSCSNISDIYIR